ncbi:condensation domain-containing protein, partial [Pantanalinema sp. GBBB05]|uniref:condensation domain-containing protein n=1 Tax=Pantanalinema sp. GBBB05 TaxID=2604139 RepID=UPI001D75A089|nr:hypothetical protein [Pantanalinema sp. GBBB05]
AGTYRGASVRRVLPVAVSAGLNALSAAMGVSLFVTLLAGFNAWLHQYSGQVDLVVCTPVVGRQRRETRGLLGYFNHVVALRNDLSGNPRFRELVERVGHRFVEASSYQEVPLQWVAELPSLVRVPLSRAMFVLQNTAMPVLQLDGVTVSSEFVEGEIANFDLSLSVAEHDGQLTAVLQYKTDLFNADRMHQMLAQFQLLLESITTNAELKLSELPQVPALSRCSVHPMPPKLVLGGANYVAPRNELECQMVQIWQRLLDVPSIGVQDNFFELGGHSLLAVKLFTEIDTTFGKQLPLSTLIVAPTIAKLAEILAASSSPLLRDTIVELRAGQGRQSLFMLHDGDGETLLYRPLANCLDPAISVYGVHPYACVHHPIRHTRIKDMVNYYIDQIRQVQPQGPYFLAGLCAGGVLAFEIARQLQIQGQSIGMVAVIDAADVAAEKRIGYMAEQRLNSFLQAFSRQEQLKIHDRVWLIANQIRRKVTNLLVYELQRRLRTLGDRAKLRAFRYCLDRSLPMPQILQQIPVRTILIWAQQEYVPETRLDGDVLLFRATAASPLFDGTSIDDTPYTEQFSDPLLGWGKRVTMKVQAYDIPGGHSSMLQQPHVQHMADRIQAHINQFAADDLRKQVEQQLTQHTG